MDNISAERKDSITSKSVLMKRTKLLEKQLMRKMKDGKLLERKREKTFPLN